MGCNKSNCLLCKKEIKGKDHFDICLKQMEHTEKIHPEIFEKNMKAELEYKDDMQKALDKKLKNSKLPLFTQTVWDGRDMTDEDLLAETGHLPMDDDANCVNDVVEDKDGNR